MNNSTGIFCQPMADIGGASVAVAGFPFDGTVSNRPGARFGPTAIRKATVGCEDYSPYLDRDIADIAVHDAGDTVLPVGDVKGCFAIIRDEYRRLVGRGLPVIAIGGEHSISPVLVEGVGDTVGDGLFVVQFDAHADLRDEYCGVKYSHACAMRRIVDVVGEENTAAVGIRSGTRDEWAYLRKKSAVYGGASGHPLGDFAAKAAELKGRPVYVTVDVDVFDPGIMPGTGTPEPGGLQFAEFMACLASLRDSRIVGADIVELAPDYDSSGISQALAATVLRELILLAGGKR